MVRSETIRVLLVEDNPADARLAREMLADCTVHTFETAHVETLDDALVRLETGGFHVALLDLSLPDAHGLGSVSRVREAHPTLPIVILSGLDDEETALDALH